MFYCDICWVEFNSATPKNIHLQSKQHMLNISFQLNLKNNTLRTPHYCQTCSIQTDTDDVLKKHLNSEKHMMKLSVKEKITSSEHYLKSSETQLLGLKTSSSLFFGSQLELNDNEESKMKKIHSSYDLAIDKKSQIKQEEPAITINSENVSNQCLFQLNEQQQQPRLDLKINNEFFCKICLVNTNSKTTFDKHLNSNKHKNKESLFHSSDIERDIIQPDHLKLHSLNSKMKESSSVSQLKFDQIIPATETCQPSMLKHCNTVYSFKNLDQFFDDVKSNQRNLLIESKREYYKNSEWCHCCFIKYTSEIEKERHLAGKLHLKRFEVKEIILSQSTASSYNEYCLTCFVLNDVNHVSSIGHLTRQQRYDEYKLATEQKEQKEESIVCLSQSSSLMSFKSAVDTIMDKYDAASFNDYNNNDQVLISVEQDNSFDNDDSELNEKFVCLKRNSTMESRGIKIFRFFDEEKANKNQQIKANAFKLFDCNNTITSSSDEAPSYDKKKLEACLNNILEEYIAKSTNQKN